MELRRYVLLLWRWLWLIALGTAVATIVALLVSLYTPPTYESSVRLLVNQAQTPGTVAYNDILTSERLTKTYSEMMRTYPVLESVISELKLEISAEEFSKLLNVQVVRDTMLLVLTAKSGDPQQAADIANTVARTFIDENQKLSLGQTMTSRESLSAQLEALNRDIRSTSDQIEAIKGSAGGLSAEARQSETARLQATLSQYQLTYSQLLKSEQDMRLSEAKAFNSVRVVEPARPKAIPVSPKILQNVLLAALVGLMLSAGVALLLEYLDDTVKSGEEVVKALGAPSLGHVVKLAEKEAGPVVNGEPDPRSPMAESFRALRTNLQFSLLDRPNKVMLVTSSSPGEGKTTVSVNLAQVIAQAGKRVILVDADLRRPSVHKHFGMRNESGLTSALLDTVSLDSGVLRPTHLPNLHIITSGPIPPNPSELLGSPRMTALIESLRGKADVVLFDCPPALVVTDPTVLASKVDGVLVVVDSGRTRAPELARVREVVERAAGEGKILGAVLNKLSIKSAGYYHYQYHSNYGHDPAETNGRNGKEHGKASAISRSSGGTK